MLGVIVPTKIKLFHNQSFMFAYHARTVTFSRGCLYTGRTVYADYAAESSGIIAEKKFFKKISNKKCIFSNNSFWKTLSKFFFIFLQIQIFFR